MTKLSVNVNKIALLRNARDLNIPNVRHFSKMVLEAGACGITIHPRPDERHIKRQDVCDLSTLFENCNQIEFNIEGNPFHQLLDLALEFCPTQATLVPDEVSAVTSDHGWDLSKDGGRLEPVISKLKAKGIRVSLFMDPSPEEISMAKAIGADRVELYTEPYARAYNAANRASVVEQYKEASIAATEVGLEVNAGHDLNLDNLAYFLSEVSNVKEVSIGHALTADLLEFGVSVTVKKYLYEIDRAYR